MAQLAIRGHETRGKDTEIDWEKVRINAAIAAMPIADKIVDGLNSSKYKSANSLHTISSFVNECVGIADALVERLKQK